MLAARQLHPRRLASAASVSAYELFAALVLGIGVAMFVAVALFVLAASIGWHFYKRHWDKLAQEIEKAALAKAEQAKREADAAAEKARIEKEAEGLKTQPAVDTANSIINE